MTQKKIRFLIADEDSEMAGRGSRALALALRDSGCEVVFMGSDSGPDAVVNVSLQEDADGIGLFGITEKSFGDAEKILEILRRLGAEDIRVFAGGDCSEEVIRNLTAKGLSAFFPRELCAAAVASIVKEKISI